ncbi:MAG: thioredoxin domain-containing protein, partial [Pirellulales bacterium]
MSNKLARESSPYLLQHKENPVDWFPWGEEAIEKARAERKPIFLSIGYSACHWCHVMEHESFENEALAAKLNESFVSIKVDREERPDLDQLYMNAVQVMTGRGGWPMSVFLTPELKPFYGGTYWPPTARMGMPGFGDVLDGVLDAWNNRHDQVTNQADRLTDYLVGAAELADSAGEVDLSLLTRAAAQLEKVFDRTHGGFGRAPKFPHPLDLLVLLRVWKRTEREGWLDMVRLTLDKMAAGGIYDQLGGGFHRYSVDERWLAPHFEKMLYDNALLSAVYVEAYQATGDEAYADTAHGIYRYVLREMTDPAGGFYSTQDADSECVEGKFFVWSPDEIRSLLGEQAGGTFCYVYDVTEEGNFEGHNILHQQRTLDEYAKQLGRDADDLQRELAASRQCLLQARAQRVKPALDDKVLVNWNGLMIDSLARAAGALGEEKYLKAAAAAGEFIWVHVRDEAGRLRHLWRRKAKFAAYLDDYAALMNGYVSLYEATFDETWIDRACELADAILTDFEDAESGGFYYTANDHEQLIARQKDATDSATPSGGSLATYGLLRLGKLTGAGRYLDAAARSLAVSATLMEESPLAAGQMLMAVDFYLGPTPE